MKKKQQEQISSEKKTALIKEKLETAESAKTFLALRQKYPQIVIVNIIQASTYPLVALYVYFYREISEFSSIPFLFFFSLTTVILGLGSFLNYLSFKRKYRDTLRAHCLFASVSVAECLESGDKVGAAFYAEKLFEIFPMFARNTKVEIGPWKTNLTKLLTYDVEETYHLRRAIGSAIMVQKDETLSNEFYSLADQLFSKDAPNNYDVVQQSLRRIVESSKEYRRKELTFLDKHPNVKNAVMELSEYVKLTMVVILQFILWLVFGYAK